MEDLEADPLRRRRAGDECFGDLTGSRRSGTPRVKAELGGGTRTKGWCNFTGLSPDISHRKRAEVEED